MNRRPSVGKAYLGKQKPYDPQHTTCVQKQSKKQVGEYTCGGKRYQKISETTIERHEINLVDLVVGKFSYSSWMRCLNFPTFFFQ